jgi:hypothetical protein
MEAKQTVQTSLMKAIMNYGAILGIAQVLVSLIFYALGKGVFEIESSLHVFLTISVISLGIRNYRDHQLQGRISYLKSVKMATLIAFFGAIVLGFAYYIYVKFVDSSILSVVLEQTEKTMIAKHYPADQISIGMYYSRKFAPFILFLVSIFKYTLLGLLFALVFSIFLKKKKEVTDMDHSNS